MISLISLRILGMLILSATTSIHAQSYEEQPKILTSRGNLILEAVRDQNITFHLLRDSALFINGVNVLDGIRQKFLSVLNITNQQEASPFLPTVANVKKEIRTLKRDLQRMSTRFSNLQNSTRVGTQAQASRRILGRIRRLLTRVTHIELSLVIDECMRPDQLTTNPCKNGGTCFDGYKDFHCECTDGWMGKTCEDDVNECYLYAGTDLGCQNNANCTNSPGSYSCSCRKGFFGRNCRLRNAICETAQSAELCVHGVCVHANNDHGYTCICDQGWTKNNGTTPACIDVNECDESRNPCHNECINLPGSFKCGACPRGYTGNGVTCVDIDECASNNGGCSLRPKVTCINSEGSYHCGSCPIGWLGDGHNCELAPSNSCDVENICHVLAKCEYISETVVCTCPHGMYGHGFGPTGCTAEATTNPCENHMCKNNGTCIESGRGTRCICAIGYTGAMCDQNDACHPNPCLSGGTCNLLPNNKFNCACKRGTTGSTCQILRNTCGSIVRQETGVLSYPEGDASSYEPNERCAWIIRTGNTKILNVTFTQFDVEQSTDCTKDWLQIHDGRSLAAQLLGRFCGNTLPLSGNIVSSHQQLFFWFRSDNTTNGAGFKMSWTSQPHICGGFLNLKAGDSGVIRSPGYPGKTATNRDCDWQFDAPFGYRLVLRFYEVTLGGEPNCTRDTLMIFDSDIKLKSICENDGSMIPEPLHTSSNKVALQFHTDAYRADSSFQLHYEVIPAAPHCGGIFTEAFGTFNGYMNAKLCLYLIQQPEGTQIKLEFTSLHLNKHKDCLLQKVEIFDGKTDEDPLMKRICSHDIPEPFISSGNFMLLRFEYLLYGFELSDTFEAKYTRICDSSYFGPDGGVFTTPNYPNAYYDHISCTFNIYGPINTVIQLNFTDFSMSQRMPDLMTDASNKSALADDYADYVDVYLSNNNKRRFYKGDPMIILSDKNHARVVFHSNVNSLKARGIRVEYSFKNMTCGGVLTADNGTIVNEYVSTFCEWVIEAPVGKHILLDLVFISIARHCEPEIGEILIYTNNSDGTGKLAGSYCNQVFLNREPYHTNILTIILRDTQLIEKFTSYHSLVANYSFVNSDEACNAHFTSRSGIIKSPGWPKGYDASMNCTWVISAPIGHKIELVVHNFSLETTSRTVCRDDKLEIRNGKNKFSPLIGTYCGSKIPARIPSFTNDLYLNFVSDDFISAMGFYITWEQTATGCGGKLTSNMGSIHSPINYKYSSSAISCDWQIIVAQGSTIDINVTKILTDSICKDRMLTIYDGPTSASRVLKLNCTSFISFVKSTTNQVLVRHEQDEFAPVGQGFVLDYDTNCNVFIDNLQGVVESPNFPEEYPAFMNCAWDIHGGRNNKISLEFSHLQLEKSNSDCNYDYVEVIDMRNDLVLTKRKYCDSPPNAITSEGNHILLKFVSDYSDNGLGFHAEYKRLGCGEHLQAQYTNFGSPNAPYSVDMDCDWYIEAPAGKQIILNIRELHIDTEKQDCTVDALTITEDKNSTNYLLRECKVEQMPITITSPANRLYVHFVTSDTRARKYFKASTSTVDAKCGGTYRGNSGIISSPDLTNGYDTSVECVWNILVEDSYYISLTFTEFNITYSSTCSDTFVELKRIDDKGEDLLKRVCGDAIEPIIKVRSNHLSVTLKVGLTGFANFKMLYKKECGGPLIQTEGYFKSNSDEHCDWTIQGPEGSYISITLLHLDCLCSSTKDANCSSFLKYSTSMTSNNSVTTNICDNNKAHFIVPTINLFISASEVNFRGKYSTIQNSCGGTLTSLSGILASPYYPSTYPANVECVWEIEAPSGNYIELNFLDLDIVKSEHCNDDFLEIRTAERGKMLGLYCSSEVQTDTLIGFEKLWIKFRSSESTSTANGFKLSWSLAHTNEINAPSGTIESPPLLALRQQEPYSWRIVVLRGELVSLNFQEYNEGLNLYDGFDEVALKIDINYSPWEFIASTNVIYLTSNNAELERFKIVWRSVSSEAVKANTTANKCHNELTLPSFGQVNISSPGYPHGYSGNQICDWIIKPKQPTQHVVFKLFEAKLEDFPECRVDYLRALSSSNLEDWHEELKICQSEDMKFRAINVIHGTPYIRLEFNTDATVNGTGFTALAMPACGSKMTGPVGTILASELTYHETSCLWHIKVKPGKRISFDFEFNDNVLKSGEQCAQYAIIYDGLDSGAPILPPGQICNRKDRNVKSVISTSHQVTLKYNITWTYGLPSPNLWNLTYREYSDCGGEVRLTHFANSINISSPRYPNVPQPYSECDWIIMGPAGESLQATFIDRFDLNTRFCSKEYVELFDGSSALGRSLGRYCTKPSNIRTTGNIMFLRYITNIAEPRMGFRVNVSLAICGGTYTSVNGQISSNGYPALGAYPKYTTCEYKIELPIHFRLRLNFSDLHLPFDASNLNGSDRIEILSLDNTLVFYGNVTEMPMLDFESNEVLIRFRSFQGGNKYRGFSLKYSRTYGNCYRDVSGESGLLVLNNPYPVNIYMTCRWKITVPKGQRVRLEFLSWTAPSANNSTARFLAIASGTQTQNMYRIEVYNDHDMQSKITEFDLATYNSSEIIQSTDNIMSVRVKVRYLASTKPYVKARYSSDEESPCPPDISDSAAGLINLNALIHTNYHANFYCRVKFSLSGQQTLSFKITDLVITKNDSVITNPYLVRFKNEELFQPYMILRSNISNTLVSLSPKHGSMSIQQTDYMYIMQFSVKYRRHECGGMYQLADGFTLQHPDIIEDNYGELECVWTLQTEYDDRSFKLVGDISLGDRCEREYIVIYAGLSPDGVELARICRDSPKFNGIMLPKQYTTVIYHIADHIKQLQSKFSLIADKTVVCGSKIFVSSLPQSVALTGKAYKNNMECSWEFESNRGLFLTLAFIGRFFIEDSINCTKDHLEVQRFEGGLWLPEARYCGREVPNFLNVTSNRMQVIFRTNENVTGDGFGFQVSINCNVSFNVTSGVTQIIPSPRFNKFHTHNMHCEYTFRTNSENLINVRIRERVSINLPMGMFPPMWNRACELASITVFKVDGEAETNKFCVSGEVRSHNYLRLEYTAYLEKNFDIEYELNTCGGNITMPTVLRPPQHEEHDKYADNMKCNWYVVAPPDHSIVLSFKYFDMEYSTNCSYDYVAIYAGAKISDEKVLTKLCGNLTDGLPFVMVDGNQAVISAASDLSFSAKGFLARVFFTRNCNERITLTDGNSPLTLVRHFNVTAAEVLVCGYMIVAPPGYRVALELRELQLNSAAVGTYCGNCDNCNNIEVLDSFAVKRVSMGKYCTNGRSDVKLLTSHEDMFLRLHALKTGQYSFEIVLQMEKSICGNNMDLTLQPDAFLVISFPSPGTELYPPNTHCMWRIRSTEEFRIEFTSLLLQNVSQVTGKCIDYLHIKGNYLSQYFCGNSTGFHVFAPKAYSADVEITFHSDSMYEDKGFSLTAVHRTNCNRTYTKLSDIIIYSNWESSSFSCVDEVRVSENYTLSLYLPSIFLHDANCSNVHFKVVDIHSNKTLLSHCTDVYSDVSLFTTTNALRIYTASLSYLKLFYVASSKALPPGCGGQLFTTNGHFSSPPYRDDRNHSVCRWDIRVPSPNKISLSFYTFDMGTVSNCQLDHVDILEVASDGSEKSIKSYCGQDIPETFVTTGSQVAVISTKSANFDGIGWTISYMTYEDPYKWRENQAINIFS